MQSSSPPPDASAKHGLRRRLTLVMARVGALSFSCGVVAFLMMKASGCGSTEEARPENATAAATPGAASTTPGGTATDSGSSAETPAASAPNSKPGGYLGGSKSWGGPDMVELLSSSATTSASAPKPKPTFFPGTKAAPIHVERNTATPPAQQK